MFTYWPAWGKFYRLYNYYQFNIHSLSSLSHINMRFSDGESIRLAQSKFKDDSESLNTGDVLSDRESKCYED